jgi:hypothetical protein
MHVLFCYFASPIGPDLKKIIVANIKYNVFEGTLNFRHETHLNNYRFNVGSIFFVGIFLYSWVYFGILIQVLYN